jgi:hypothetical protein
MAAYNSGPQQQLQPDNAMQMLPALVRFGTAKNSLYRGARVLRHASDIAASDIEAFHFSASPRHVLLTHFMTASRREGAKVTFSNSRLRSHALQGYG